MLVKWHLFIESAPRSIPTFVIVVLNAIFCYIWLHYNRSQLYVQLIKSPQYTGGDFMFLYWFVRRRRRRRPQVLVHTITFERLFGFLSFFRRRRRRRRRPPPPAADSCSRDNFWTTFWISFICSTIVGPDLQITWLDFGRFLSWPWPRFFKVKYGICYISPKNGPIATKRKANISIEL